MEGSSEGSQDSGTYLRTHIEDLSIEKFWKRVNGDREREKNWIEAEMQKKR